MNPELKIDLQMITSIYDDKVKIHDPSQMSEFIEGIATTFADQSNQIGRYLFRAVTDTEWKEIERHNGRFLIRTRTNFENDSMFETVNSQVKGFAKKANTEGYSGKIIRIDISQTPFFGIAGMQSPRIESILPHFARIDGYTDSNQINSESIDWQKISN